MTAPAATEERGLQTSAVDPQIVAAMQVFERLKPLQNALGLQDLSPAEMQLFGMVAYRTGLDPFTRQIYAIKRDGKVTHQTGIDGYRSVAERTGQYAGSSEAEYETCTCDEKPAGHPAVARVVVHRILPDGHVMDQTGTARWHELKPNAGQSGKGDAMWQKMPFNQLAKCAEANALRKAFPRVLGDVYVAEEMEQAGPPDNGRLVEASTKPDPKSRLAARRAAVEPIEGEIVEPAIAADPGPDLGTTDDGRPLDLATGEVLEGLTAEQLTALLKENRIAREFAIDHARRQFPDWDPKTPMTDEQRGQLWQALKPEGGAS